MQLVNLEVKSGELSGRCKLSALTPGLNVVYGPSGSGKSRLWDWLSNMFASDGATATPIFADHRAAGIIDLRLGRNNVRMEVSEFQPDRLPSPISHMQQQALAELLAVQSDSSAISRLHALARTLGLADAYLPDQLGQRQYLLERQRELESRLRRLDSLSASREALLARKTQLEGELTSLRALQPKPLVDLGTERQRLCNLISSAEEDLQRTSRQIDELEAAIARLAGQLSKPQTNSIATHIPESYRDQMSELDGQLFRWRQTLREVRAYRDRLEHNATDLRLDQQIGDQISTSKQAEPRVALRALEGQILTLREQLASLVNRYRSYQSAEGFETEMPLALQSLQRELYDVCQQLSRHEAQSISQTLAEQSAQLGRCETELRQAIEKLIGQRGELLRRIAEEFHLSDAELSLAFGDWCECHNHPHLHEWLQNEEGPPARVPGRLDDQPLRQEVARLEEELRLMQERRTSLRRELLEHEMQLRKLGDLRTVELPQRTESDVAQELNSVNRDLLDIDSKQQIATELGEVQRRLLLVPTALISANRFKEVYNYHLSALSGNRSPNNYSARSVAPHRPFANAHFQSNSRLYESHHRPSSIEWAARQPDYQVMRNPNATHGAQRFYAEATQSQVAPDAIVELALRLSIAQCLAENSNPLPLIIDSTLDQLPVEWQEAAIRHLADIACQSQQIIVATRLPRVEKLVRQFGGAGHSMSPESQASAPTFDVNRVLHAFANEHETEKWQEPLSSQYPISPAQSKFNRHPSRVRSSTYLVEASLIDHLPSIPAAVVAEMKSLGIQRIADLLDVAPDWLANNLQTRHVGLANVQSWQAEARLLCRVPKLRPFDARVLVGAGIRQPSQLAEMHPSRLLDQVEQFLATERGREILRSGNSYELSRITSWIASAKNGTATVRRDNVPDVVPRANSGQRDRSVDQTHGLSTHAQVDESPRSRRGNSAGSNARTAEGSAGKRRSNAVTNQARRKNKGSLANAHSPDSGLKYYLNLSSPVVDAPAIGPRMAERLNQSGVATVDNLLAANPESLATRIGTKQVTSEIVRLWQEQARLVCRIPNLRGHDAQMLVAAGISSPEDLASLQPAVVLQQVTAVANTAEGQRVLRGSQAPDLAEVTNWIRWAAISRSIQAA